MSDGCGQYDRDPADRGRIGWVTVFSGEWPRGVSQLADPGSTGHRLPALSRAGATAIAAAVVAGLGCTGVLVVPSDVAVLPHAPSPPPSDDGTTSRTSPRTGSTLITRYYEDRPTVAQPSGYALVDSCRPRCIKADQP